MIEDIISKLNLLPHPEGGYYAETYRSDVIIDCDFIGSNDNDSKRNASTGIYFLVLPGKCSRLHKIKSDEVWHFYLGSPLTVVEVLEDGNNNSTIKKTILGQDFMNSNQVLQHVVKRNTWFGCYCDDNNNDSDNKFSLVGCTVAPGFDFRDFELSSRKDLLSKFQSKEDQDLVISLTEGLP